MLSPANTMMQIMIVLILPEIKRLRTHDTNLICIEGMQVENYFNIVFLHANGGSCGCEGDTFSPKILGGDSDLRMTVLLENECTRSGGQS